MFAATASKSCRARSVHDAGLDTLTQAQQEPIAALSIRRRAPAQIVPDFAPVDSSTDRQALLIGQDRFPRAIDRRRFELLGRRKTLRRSAECAKSHTLAAYLGSKNAQRRRWEAT